jgi:hypothetical protein
MAPATVGAPAPMALSEPAGLYVTTMELPGSYFIMLTQCHKTARCIQKRAACNLNSLLLYV